MKRRLTLQEELDDLANELEGVLRDTPGNPNVKVGGYVEPPEYHDIT